jgi:hypothetical protein
MNSNRPGKFVCFAALAAVLSLSACKGQETELAKLDNQIIGNDTDPALTDALEDQIMVDPALTQQSNKNAVRSPTAPPQAQYPLPAGGQAKAPAASGAAPAGAPGRPNAAAAPAQGVQRASAAHPATGGEADCAPSLNYNRGWARRLPPAFAVYPGARLTDAAGNDSAGCRARIVTFTTDAPPQRVLEHYRARAVGAGYSAEHQMRGADHVLAGAAGAGGAAFYLILTPLRGGGSDVAMITNGG